MFSLEDKITLVTGGGSGIGKAICLAYAKQGATVVVTDINAQSANEVAAEIAESGGQAMALGHDASSERDWEQVMDSVLARYGKLDVVVNNAGLVFPGTIEEQSLAEWRKTEEVNVQGVFLGTQKAVAAMKEQGGSIINISSIDGLVGDPKAIAYNASKGAVRTLTKSAALHCADKGYGVRVNSVHPGYILTPLVEKAFAEAGPEWVEEYQRLKISRIPVGELGKPEDIAAGCVYLAADEARYVTGTELVIDGGFTAS